MNTESRFKIIFVKLAEALAQQPKPEAKQPEATPEELDEIDELRRLAMEITAPEPTSYTTT